MSKRQKSFFDQDPIGRISFLHIVNTAHQSGAQAVPYWQRNRRPYNTPREVVTNYKPAKAMPPIAASSQSKAKLKAFQFVENKSRHSSSGDPPRIEEADKENTRALQGPPGPSASQSKPCSQTSSQISALQARGECPETPVGRLPLAELIGNTEDALAHGELDAPYERVIWDLSPQGSDQANSLGTRAGRRGKKRAHSSSPSFSSPNEASGHFAAAKRSFDLQTLQKSLKTPQVDPAGDLWSRYSMNSNDKQSPTAPGALKSIDLMISSSPQTPAMHFLGRDSGLRRTVSCGTEWLTSISKRRKIHHHSSHEEGNAILAAHAEPGDGRSTTKLSRVSLLVDMVQERLAKPVDEADIRGLSSSSPLPDTGSFDYDRASPLLQRAQAQAPERELSSTENNTLRKRMRSRQKSPEAQDQRPDNKKPFSGYGDDDIDFELLDTVDAATASTSGTGHQITSELFMGDFIPRMTPVQPLAALGDADNDQPAPRGALNPEIVGSVHYLPEQTLVQTTEHQSVVQAGEETDEFGDGDSDLFAADLQDVVAMYDSLQPQNNQAPAENMAEDEHDALPQAVKVAISPRNDIRKTEPVEVSSGDEFGEDLDFEQIAVEYASATQGFQGATPRADSNGEKLRTIQRYLIMTVDEAQYETEKGQLRPEKILLLQDDKTKANKAVTLRQSWFDSPCTTGSYIHLIGDFDRAGQCIVDDARNMLILHPDHLISATVVADSFSCTRRAVLQDRVKATNEANGPQVYGHILHEIFQEAMRANRWDTEWFTVTIGSIAARYHENLFEINVELGTALEYLNSKVPELQAWAEIFVTARPKAGAVVKDRNGGQALMSINKLLDVEEHVWSPMYGLKGNIDATVQVTMQDGEEETTLIVPFEVKTGSNSSNAAHKAQTALYTLLLSDRYDVEIAYGILYYMETSEISRIPAIRHEIRHMVMQRNELACYVRQRLDLPPMLKSSHHCGKCYAKTPCFIYHKLVDGGDGETSGMKEKFGEVAKHLKPAHQEFFKKWDDLLTKEEKDVLKFRRELWTMSSTEREKVGRCFANVVIEPGSAFEMEEAQKINRFRYTFIKQKPATGFSFTESQITTGEPIVISDEKGHFALANGYVTNVRKHRITVAVDRRLHNARTQGRNFDAQRNQVFTGIMEVFEEGREQSTSTPQEPEGQVLYRLDKDEFSNGMATVRNNLIRIMEKDLFGAQALRKLVIEGVAPTFKPTPSAYTLGGSASQASLNVDQKRAIEKVMGAKDYALVLGMPGTGKTTTIAHIIRALAAQGKSILLTSYTHTAVDNILLKIRNDNIGILRIGAVAKVHPEVQEFADLVAVPKKTVEELKRSYSQQVVATTCLGINHPIFNQRVFDYCIVDEASQITLPVCLGPIRMARTFILVGDHYQLPPLVQSKEALEGGLDISLFRLLSETHPSSVVTLEHQYRMCSDIMLLSNILIYSGRLKCGTPAVATRSTPIPNLDALQQHHHTSRATLFPSQQSICLGPVPGSCWLRDLLDPKTKACFVNTDPLLPASREEAKGSRIVNAAEATLCTHLVEALLSTGVPATDIGVITLYRSQLALLKQQLRHRCDANGLEMHTADRFQGRDKEVVILSLVRSNEQKNVGDLLRDWRRVNVAFTRARSKLLVLGSRETLGGNELLSDFLRLVEGEGWRYDLPGGALGEHVFGGGASPGLGWEGSQVMGRGKSQVRKVEGKEGGKKVEGKEGGKKVPGKVVRGGGRAILGARGVLRDVVNEVL